jgi:hypothetical protein
MKYLMIVLVAALALASPARANCYEHCHTDSAGNTTCHVNCY